MEETKKNAQTNKEEITFYLTFNPDAMLKQIADLSEETKQLKLEKEILTMLLTDATLWIVDLQKRIPKSWLRLFQDWLLELFGGQYEHRN